MKFLHLTVKDTGCNGGLQSVTSFLRGSKKIQLTPDNLNLLRKLKNVQVIGSSLKQITGNKKNRHMGGEGMQLYNEVYRNGH